jgi:putative transposase
MKEDYNHENRHKYYLKFHLIFCIKYRRKILKGEFDDNIKAVFQSIADNSDFNIDIMETDKDHIHFLISYPPKLSVTSIVRKLKQESTVFAWHLYGSMLRKYFWKEKILWSDGYFVCSIGEANPNTVREYIRQQG